QCADAAFDSIRHKSREQIEKQIRISQPFRRCPVWLVHLLLDPWPVEAPEGKSIDGENVATVLPQPALKFQEGRAIGEFLSRALAQAQADSVRLLLRADAFPDAQGVVLERRESLRPRLAAVNIRAIGKMQSRLQFHPVD